MQASNCSIQALKNCGNREQKESKLRSPFLYAANVVEQQFSEVEMQESEYFRPKWTGIGALPPPHTMRLKRLVILTHAYSRICIRKGPPGDTKKLRPEAFHSPSLGSAQRGSTLAKPCSALNPIGA